MLLIIYQLMRFLTHVSVSVNRISNILSEYMVVVLWHKKQRRKNRNEENVKLIKTNSRNCLSVCLSKLFTCLLLY